MLYDITTVVSLAEKNQGYEHDYPNVGLMSVSLGRCGDTYVLAPTFFRLFFIIIFSSRIVIKFTSVICTCISRIDAILTLSN